MKMNVRRTVTLTKEEAFRRAEQEYVGKEATPEVVAEIEYFGYAYAISCQDGTIARIIQPVFPKKVIE